jgi:hypothetical protein
MLVLLLPSALKMREEEVNHGSCEVYHDDKTARFHQKEVHTRNYRVAEITNSRGWILNGGPEELGKWAGYYLFWTLITILKGNSSIIKQTLSIKPERNIIIGEDQPLLYVLISTRTIFFSTRRSLRKSIYLANYLTLDSR